MTEQPIAVLTALSFIRKRPALLFGAEGPSLDQLVALVLQDVMGSSSSVDCVVTTADSRAVIAANVDWMITDKASFEELWTRFVMPTPLRTNSHRSEVLLAGVCTSVQTQGVAGSIAFGPPLAEPDARMLAHAGESGRWLTFRFDG